MEYVGWGGVLAEGKWCEFRFLREETGVCSTRAHSTFEGEM